MKAWVAECHDDIIKAVYNILFHDRGVNSRGVKTVTPLFNSGVTLFTPLCIVLQIYGPKQFFFNYFSIVIYVFSFINHCFNLSMTMPKFKPPSNSKDEILDKMRTVLINGHQIEIHFIL